jgi:hypothetical protein
MVHLRNGPVSTRWCDPTFRKTISVRLHISKIPDSVLEGWSTHRCLIVCVILVSMAILGGYFGIYLLYKMSSMFSKKKPVVETAPVVVAATESTGVPSIESTAFEKFVETIAFEQLLENEGQLSKLLESA